MSRGFLDEDDPRADDRDVDDDRKTFDVVGKVKNETAAAILIHDGIRETWVPKKIALRVEHAPQLGITTVRLPLWWAKRKGLI